MNGKNITIMPLNPKQVHKGQLQLMEWVSDYKKERVWKKERIMEKRDWIGKKRDWVVKKEDNEDKKWKREWIERSEIASKRIVE